MSEQIENNIVSAESDTSNKKNKKSLIPVENQEEKSSKKKKTPRDSNTKDESLLRNLAEEINKENKDGGKLAFFLDEKEDPSNITDWISTGSSLLDLAISNRPNGGLPVGRMAEFHGLEGTNKSLICANIMANTQKKGGLPIYIDTENAAAPEFWKSLGVDVSKMMYIPCETVEEIFEVIEKSIVKVKSKNPDLLLSIVVDSVAAASTSVEQASTYAKDGFATTKSIVLSKAMRKITNMLGRQKVLIVFTNQVRQNIGGGPFSEKFVVSGGKALAFHCSVRVKLSNIGKIKNAEKEVIGKECQAKVIKTRFGPPDRVVDFQVYFDSGIADYASWIDVLKKYEHITGSKSPYKYMANDGTEYVIHTREFVKLLTENPILKEELYNKICDSYIMKYKDPNSKIVEDAEIVVGDDDDAVADE